jgi:hypothetical protein
MTAVIEAQMANGEHISKHLTSTAVDVRSRNRDKELFLHVATNTPGVTRLLEEGIPPHFHLQFEDTMVPFSQPLATPDVPAIIP